MRDSSNCLTCHSGWLSWNYFSTSTVFYFALTSHCWLHQTSAVCQYYTFTSYCNKAFSKISSKNHVFYPRDAMYENRAKRGSKYRVCDMYSSEWHKQHKIVLLFHYFAQFYTFKHVTRSSWTRKIGPDYEQHKPDQQAHDEQHQPD